MKTWLLVGLIVILLGAGGWLAYEYLPREEDMCPACDRMRLT